MPRKVLLVDDNLAVQKLVELTLRKEGFEVTPVDNALSALDLALKNPPELILADYNLEGMSVFSFVEKIRQKQRLSEIPIVLLINSTESYNPAQLQSAGIQSFLKKPIDSKELARQVKIQTGTAETVTMDVNALPQKGETSLSEHFSNSGSDAVKIEELLGWSSPGTLGSDMTQQMKMDQTVAAPVPSPAKAPPPPPRFERPEAERPIERLEAERPIEERPADPMEETQYFQAPPTVLPPLTPEAIPEAPPEPPMQSPPVAAPPERVGVRHEIFVEKAPAPPVDDSERARPAAGRDFPPVDSREIAEEIAKEIRKNVSQAVEKVAWEILPSLIESALTKEAIASIVEKIVWEAVPSIAETEIKKEIKRLQGEENAPPNL